MSVGVQERETVREVNVPLTATEVLERNNVSVMPEAELQAVLRSVPEDQGRRLARWIGGAFAARNSHWFVVYQASLKAKKFMALACFVVGIICVSQLLFGRYIPAMVSLVPAIPLAWFLFMYHKDIWGVWVKEHLKDYVSSVDILRGRYTYREPIPDALMDVLKQVVPSLPANCHVEIWFFGDDPLVVLVENRSVYHCIGRFEQGKVLYPSHLRG
jgi:hypothetical protein